MKPHSILLSLFVVSLSLALGDVLAADEDSTSYYLIGNSLTWDTVPSKLDGDVQWHVDCGKSLPYIFEHPESPCVKTSTLWTQAFEDKQYDIVSVQPHYGTTLDEDLAVISRWLVLQPKAIFVIHTGWARAGTRAEEYAKQDAAGPMSHSRAYFEALLGELRLQYPDRQFRQTHAIDLLAKIADDIAAQKVASIPLQDVVDLHRDAIHMKLDSGRYLMHNAMRHALGQPKSLAGFESLDPAMRQYLDSVLETLP
ncbi:MAG: hypothetical protein H6822_21435 [Planctomycetaceae bacterium]|nr:hypothetical protein [Planctomycetales bacterium]MCB9924758.1 hypothetical protein [Planctomycetaceae bacterium]